MLELVLPPRGVFTRPCITSIINAATPGLRRHRPMASPYTYLNTSLTRPSSPISHSRALYCTHQTNISTTKLGLTTTPQNKPFHTTSCRMGDRPEIGKGSGHLEEQSAAQGDDWQNRPPYRTTDDNDKFEKRHTAHCHCGRVKYWLSREKPLAAKFCHCIDCQALHGAPFQWAAIFHKEDLHFENGGKDLAFYHAPSKGTHYELPVKVSCAHCHSPIMDEGRNMVLMFPGIIKFRDAEDKKLFDPQCHIFYSQRVIDIPDGKDKWTGLDKTSEIMKDVKPHEAETVVGERKVEKAE